MPTTKQTPIVTLPSYTEHEVKCAECGAKMRLIQSKTLKYKSDEFRLFYGCCRYPRCNGRHGAHPDGKPLGIPANEETRALRHALHNLFDPLWREAGWNIKQAYKWLADVLQKENAHIGSLNAEECRFVIEKINAKSLDKSV